MHSVADVPVEDLLSEAALLLWKFKRSGASGTRATCRGEAFRSAFKANAHMQRMPL
jgi:hypothetical protein